MQSNNRWLIAWKLALNKTNNLHTDYEYFKTHYWFICLYTLGGRGEGETSVPIPKLFILHVMIITAHEHKGADLYTHTHTHTISTSVYERHTTNVVRTYVRVIHSIWFWKFTSFINLRAHQRCGQTGRVICQTRRRKILYKNNKDDDGRRAVIFSSPHVAQTTNDITRT